MSMMFATATVGWSCATCSPIRPAELHAMADAIGMQRRWYQSPDKSSFPHYDLSLTRRTLAVAKGAKEITRQEVGAYMKRVKAKLITAGQTWQKAGWI